MEKKENLYKYLIFFFILITDLLIKFFLRRNKIIKKINILNILYIYLLNINDTKNKVSFNFNSFLYYIFIIKILYLLFKIISKYTNKKKLLNIIFIIMLSGSISNIIEKILYKEVIDFITFKLYKYYLPIMFNTSDIIILLSYIVLILKI
ncbi:signal peptidase II [endosymbiont of Sipalinus gigas]|uniref:signal peptidase II n=1 Tax=endosymbiont of Sipalinus gigas TaxID=1972134 RepID=UPI00102E3862|nr:signal peptidase II [endosymbiont of Sipalinus gigas]